MSGPGNSQAASKSIIKMYLVASSAEELVQMQVINNSEHGMQFVYTDPMIGPDKKWYIWFDKDMSREIRAFHTSKARETKTVKLP